MTLQLNENGSNLVQEVVGRLQRRSDFPLSQLVSDIVETQFRKSLPLEAASADIAKDVAGEAVNCGSNPGQCT